MNEIVYKGYVIEPVSLKLDTGEWRPRANIEHHTGSGVHLKVIESQVTHPTREAADEEVIKMAKAWIDENG